MMKIKKLKAQKKSATKRKPKFQYCKNCSEASQIENKVNHSEKDKIDVYSLQ